MTLLRCPICKQIPDIQLVDREIGELYKIEHCSIRVFGDPVMGAGIFSEKYVALVSAYSRWDQAVQELGR